MWPYAVKAAVYTRNRCYSQRINATPCELFTTHKPNDSVMQSFGSTCFAYLQDHKKLDPRSKEGQFIGYDGNSPAYVIYFPEKQCIRRG